MQRSINSERWLVNEKTVTLNPSATSGQGGSTVRTLRLLQLLTARGEAMTLAELADSLDIPRPTAHRLCARLLETGFIARDVDERRYGVGPALRRMALDTLNHGTLSGLRHDVLASLVAQIGETCNFTTLDGAAVLYLDRVEAERPWRLTLSPGVHVPLHCTASGKLFLAHMAEPERETLLQRLTLEPLTARTLTTAEALRAAVAETREHGYGLECEEFVVGLIALAVPVRDGGGQIRAAIAMHCPTTHVTMEEALRKRPQLEAAARHMSELL